MKRISAVLASLCLLAPLGAQAQFAKVEDAVKYRQSVFSVMGTHFSRIGAVVKGEKPYDKAAVEKDAALVETLAKLPFTAFPAGSDLPNSKAKPEVWKEQDKVGKLAEKMQEESAKLAAAAKSGNLDAIKVAFGATGKSCKACHDDYRRK